jgi:L-amino acid N-acyltransferase YncA
VIAFATGEDIPAITGIYGHYVRHGLASLEEVPPGEDEMRGRFEDIRSKTLALLHGHRRG